MENKLQVFQDAEFGQLRTVEIDGEIYFVGKDVAQILGYENSRKALIDHVDSEDKIKVPESRLQETAPVIDVTNRDGNSERQTSGWFENRLTCINESGLYSLILSSKLPTAKKFKHWVTAEVLPSIRKHGAYLTTETAEKMLNNPDFAIKLLQTIKDEREKRIAAENLIEEQRPKVIFADAVSESDSTILVGELAKILHQNGIEIGQNRLFEWLRERGYLIKRRGSDFNMPTQFSMERKLFEIKERTINSPDGSIKTTKTPKVTGRGQIYFVNRFKKIADKQRRGTT